MTYDRKRIFKNAWYITKREGGNFGDNLRKVWAQVKSYVAYKEEEAKAEILKMRKLWDVNLHPDYYTQIAYNNGTKIN